jgi:hypothetical protein
MLLLGKFSHRIQDCANSRLCTLKSFVQARLRLEPPYLVARDALRANGVIRDLNQHSAVPSFELNDLGHMNRLGGWGWISARARSALVPIPHDWATLKSSSATAVEQARYSSALHRLVKPCSDLCHRRRAQQARPRPWSCSFRSRRAARGRFLWFSRRGWGRPKARADPAPSSRRGHTAAQIGERPLTETARPDRAACGCSSRIVTGAPGGRHPGGRYVGVRLLRRITGRRRDRLPVRPAAHHLTRSIALRAPLRRAFSQDRRDGVRALTLPVQSARATARSIRARE